MKIAATLAETAAAQPAAGGAARPASDPAFDVDSDAGGPEAIEFYLLARLAAQRSVSFAGSVPMVIDDAFLGLDAAQTSSLLGKLEQVSESVQIIYLSDDPTIIEWTTSVGLSRAAAVVADPRVRLTLPTHSGAQPKSPLGGPTRGGAVAVITEAAIRELAGFRGQDAPVTTCYLDVDGRRLSRHRDYEQELERILRSARARANGTESVRSDLGRIEAYVKGGIDRTTTRGLAIFSCSAHEFWKVVPLPVPVRSRVVINQAPAVAQLESVAQEFDRFGVLLVDKQRARMLVFQLGELIDHSDLFDELPRDYDTRGHSDQGDVTGHVEALAAAHVRHAAEVAFHVFQQEPFEHLTVGAPAGLAGAIESALHPYLRERLCHRIDIGVGRQPARHPRGHPRRRAGGRASARGGGRRPVAHPERERAPGGDRAGRLAAGPARAAGRAAARLRRLQRAGLAVRHLRPPRAGGSGLPGLQRSSCTRSRTSSRRPSRSPSAQSCHVEVCVENADLDVMGRIGALLRY